MAPWSRKRKHAAEPDPRRPVDSVRLDGDDHAWWAKEEVTTAWQPPPPKAPPAPERDILAEHFGPDWRTSFGFTPPSPSPSADADADAADADDADDRTAPDPYDVLEVAPTATWDEIVAAHRHQVRMNHPDQLFGRSAEEKAKGEERIRIINAAYKELRVRRGM